MKNSVIITLLLVAAVGGLLPGLCADSPPGALFEKTNECTAYPLTELNALRSVITNASNADCPVYSQEEAELDEEGWGTTQLGAIDIGADVYTGEEDYSGATHWICYPESIVKACPDLSLSDSWHLEAYQFYEGGNANAKVFALPEGKHLLPPEEAFATGTDDKSSTEPYVFWPWPPAPAYADQNVMAHITGDDSPYSYLQASLLSRQLAEVGAAWHGISWGVTDIIDSIPDIGEMNWTEPVPSSMEPVVCCTDTTCNVTFYTYSELHTQTIARNVDTYQRGTYEATTYITPIAEGEGGFWF